MSHDEHSTHWETHTPSKFNYVASTVIAIGGILLFLTFLIVVYMPNQPAPVDEAVYKQREENLATLKAEQHAQAESYAVIDKEKGIVQIPVSQAMEVVVDSFRKDAAIKEPWVSPEAKESGQ